MPCSKDVGDNGSFLPSPRTYPEISFIQVFLTEPISEGPSDHPMPFTFVLALLDETTPMPPPPSRASKVHIGSTCGPLIHLLEGGKLKGLHLCERTHSGRGSLPDLAVLHLQSFYQTRAVLRAWDVSKHTKKHYIETLHYLEKARCTGANGELPYPYLAASSINATGIPHIDTAKGCLRGTLIIRNYELYCDS